MVSSLCDLGNAQERTRLCPSSVRPVVDLSPRAGMGLLPAPQKIFPDFEAELGFSGIHCIMFSGSVFQSAPLSTTAEIFTIPFLVRSSATCPKTTPVSSPHSDPRTVPHSSEHPRRLEHCWRFRDLRITTVQSASLNVSRCPGEGVIKHESLPKYPVGVSRRPLRSRSHLHWCLLFRVRPAPGHQPILHWSTTSRCVQSLRKRSM